MKDVEAIGRTLYSLRRSRDLTIEQVSDEVGISIAALVRYENGQRMPKLDILARIADFYGITLDYLVGRTNEDEEDDELWTLREECRRDPERRRLFKVAKYGSLNQVKQADAIINALAATNPDYYDGDDPA